MPKIEKFLQNKKEFKENYEGLRIEPKLITIDGPDGSGKTTVAEELVKQLKEKFKTYGLDPEDVLYIKYRKLLDTESQQRLAGLISGYKDEEGVGWDEKRIEQILKLISARLNRSYGDYIKPLLYQGKTIILDKSEIDLFRMAIKSKNKDLLKMITKYMKEGTLTHGISAGNRIFISLSKKEALENIKERVEKGEPLTVNDPKDDDEMNQMIKDEKKAEELISNINDSNIIWITTHRIEDEEERGDFVKKLTENIVKELDLID